MKPTSKRKYVWHLVLDQVSNECPVLKLCTKKGKLVTVINSVNKGEIICHVTDLYSANANHSQFDLFIDLIYFRF